MAEQWWNIVDRLQEQARAIALEIGIDPEVFLRQIQKESSWRWDAQGAAGEIGLGQLMPDTAEWLGVQDPWDPVQNLRGAASYLKMLLDKYGRYDWALSAYNAGPGNVDRKDAVNWPVVRRYVSDILDPLGMVEGMPAPREAGVPAPGRATSIKEDQEAREPPVPPAGTEKGPTRPLRKPEIERLFPASEGPNQAQIISREEYNDLLGPQPQREGAQ